MRNYSFNVTSERFLKVAFLQYLLLKSIADEGEQAPVAQKYFDKLIDFIGKVPDHTYTKESINSTNMKKHRNFFSLERPVWYLKDAKTFIDRTDDTMN